ncbi:uncharacterized protein [Onthophagus taurus]|uniref:uncharacterized protein n=1 Tax=Onthophagus taurus TaxID=166361 RepID=UPI0039BDB9EE
MENIKQIGDKFLVLINMKYFIIMFGLSLILYLGDVVLNIKTCCKIDPLEGSGFLIKTRGCLIPNYLTFNVKVNRRYVNNFQSGRCSPDVTKFVHSKTWHQTNIIYIDSKLVQNLFENQENFSCFYSPCNKKDLENCFNEKYLLRAAARITDLYVLVNCSYNNRIIFNDFFTFPSNKELLPRVDKKKSKNQLNVVVWGLDGVSRQGFHRHFQRTARIMARLQATQFLGYTKIGEIAFSNIIPLLTGVKDYREINSSIFSDFKNKGYLTSFAEEEKKFINLFPFEKFDFYWNTEYLNLSNNDCPQNKLFEYSERLFMYLHEKGRDFFGLFWSKKFNYLDVYLSRLLIKLEQSNVLNNTIFILVSDHGDQNNKLRLTHLGSIEDRLPLLYVYFPLWHKQSFKEAHCNLKRNAERLVTTFDIHKTLQTLTDPFNINYETNDFNLNKSVSLFSLISTRRTCETVEISSHFCSCNGFKDVGVEEDVSNEIMDYVREISNDTTKILTNRLHLPPIGFNQNFADYTVLFSSNYSNLHYEATIRKINGSDYKNHFKLIGNISEIETPAMSTVTNTLH